MPDNALPELALMFKALGDPTRLRIFEFLRSCAGTVSLSEDGTARPVQGASVGTVCCHLTGIDKISSTISFHLKELRLAGLIQVERSGKNLFCSIDPRVLEMLGGYFLREKHGQEDCCD